MKIAGMVVWVLTAGIGVYLLAAGIAAQRLADAALPTRSAPQQAQAEQPTLVGAAALASGLPLGAAPAPSATAEQADSALREFIHPVLALTGLTFWIFFVTTSGRVFAWIALGVVVAAILAGLNWAISGWRTARATGRTGNGNGDGHEAAEAHGFPPHLILLHGLAATCTLALVVIAAVAA